MSFDKMKDHEFWLLAKELPGRTGKWEFGDLFIRRPYVDNPGKWRDEGIQMVTSDILKHNLIDDDAVWLPRLDQLLALLEDIQPTSRGHQFTRCKDPEENEPKTDGWLYGLQWWGQTKEMSALKLLAFLFDKDTFPALANEFPNEWARLDLAQKTCATLYSNNWHTRFSHKIWKYPELDIEQSDWNRLVIRMKEAGLLREWYEICCPECYVSVLTVTTNEDEKGLPDEVQCDCGTEFEPHKVLNSTTYEDIWFAFTDKLMTKLVKEK